MNIIEKIDFFLNEKFKRVVRGGKVLKKLVCPIGMKAVGGKCVRMGSSEIVKRKKSTKKVQQKLKHDNSKQAKMERKRAKSIKKRHDRIPGDASKPGKQFKDGEE